MKILSILDNRIPKWDLSLLQERLCPICNFSSSNLKFKRPDDLYIHKCNQCSTYFVSPSPTKEQINNFYSKYYENRGVNSSENPAKAKQRLKKIILNDDIRIKVLKSLTEINGLNILDIGCGKGDFSYLLKSQGANVIGLDINEEAIKFSNEIGVKAIHYNDMSTLGNLKFDIIIMNDVIEHPLEPLEMLEFAKYNLIDNGLILIWTPNGDNINTDPDKIALRKDLEHMQYLGLNSIKYICLKLGFDIVYYNTLGRPSLIGVTDKININFIFTKIYKLIYNLPFFNLLNNVRKKIQYKMISNNGNYTLITIIRKK
jgi:2-polyprenyl-3-methyl-5-hydroxy-6-metoxy-1,4-benzoquinol methylase